ncbi:MAG: hypothetical protein ABSG65_19085 [Bryobacteraceae bacterium]
MFAIIVLTRRLVYDFTGMPSQSERGITFPANIIKCPESLHRGRGYKARQTGATDPEIAEVVTIAAALRAGAAVTHGAHAFPGA